MVSDSHGGEVSVTTPHYMVHKGYSFSGSGTATIGANLNIYGYFRTATAASEPKAHAVFSVTPTGAGQMTLYENPGLVTTADGSTVILQNHHRGSTGRLHTTYCSMAVYSATDVGTSNSEGTVLKTKILGGGSAGPSQRNATIGGDGATRIEWDLESATTYGVEFHNGNGANTTNVGFDIEYYIGAKA